LSERTVTRRVFLCQKKWPQRGANIGGLSGTEQTFARGDCRTSALQHYAFSVGGVFFVYAEF